MLQTALQDWFAFTIKQVQRDLTHKFAKDITSELTDWEFIEEQGQRIIKPASLKIMQTGGQQAYTLLQVKGAFDILNEASVKAAEMFTADLVREVTKETKAGIRTYIKTGIKEGKSMDKIARELRPIVGLTERQASSVANARRLLAEKDPKISAAQIDKKVARYASKTHRRRTQTIARTEAARAQNLGYVQGMDDLGVAELEFRIAPSDYCEICEGLNRTRYSVAEASGVIPVHPNCRCAMLPVLAGKTVDNVVQAAEALPGHIEDLIHRWETAKSRSNKWVLGNKLKKLGYDVKTRGPVVIKPPIVLTPVITPTVTPVARLPQEVQNLLARYNTASSRSSKWSYQNKLKKLGYNVRTGVYTPAEVILPTVPTPSTLLDWGQKHGVAFDGKFPSKNPAVVSHNIKLRAMDSKLMKQVADEFTHLEQKLKPEWLDAVRGRLQVFTVNTGKYGPPGVSVPMETKALLGMDPTKSILSSNAKHFADASRAGTIRHELAHVLEYSIDSKTAAKTGLYTMKYNASDYAATGFREKWAEFITQITKPGFKLSDLPKEAQVVARKFLKPVIPKVPIVPKPKPKPKVPEGVLPKSHFDEFENWDERLVTHKANLKERMGFDLDVLKVGRTDTPEYKAALAKFEKSLKSYTKPTTTTTQARARVSIIDAADKKEAAKFKAKTDLYFDKLDDIGCDDVIKSYGEKYTQIDIYEKGFRSSANPKTSLLKIARGTQDKVLMHEMGHLLERSDVVRRKSKQWLKMRGGEKTVSYKKIVPWSNDTQMAYKDKFIDPYVGKIYRQGETEVLSMGMQNFTSYNQMLRFAKKDFDHFSFIHGILTGAI